MPTVKLLIDYTIHNEAGMLLNQGSTLLVFVNAGTRAPMRAPKVFTDCLRQYFE
jgi:acyl-CoA thioester hydrolase